jgi:bacteriorhodopsin
LVEVSSIHSYSLLFGGLTSRLLSDKSMYGRGAVYTAVIWMIYPVCWGFSEGANVLTVDHEMILYSILDLFAGPVFLFAFLLAMRSFDYNAFGLQSGKASDYVEGRPSSSEKSGARETAA